MRKRIRVVCALALCLLLAACAPGMKGKAVSSYELAGITLKAGYDVAKPACDQGLIAPEKCMEIKEIYNEARSAYLLAGDMLVLAFEIDDLAKAQLNLADKTQNQEAKQLNMEKYQDYVAQTQAALQDYQDLAELYTMNTTALFNLLIQLDVIKKE